MMLKFKTPFLHFLIIILFIACGEDDGPAIPPGGNNGGNGDDNYEQYSTPFENVPDAEDVIMYEVNLRAFSSSGDLQGVINRVDSIAKLGVNVVWLMPIHPIGEIRSVNSPYSVRNYKEVSEEYGDLEDLRTLSNKLHSRNIAIMMDWVANHTSWDNSWIFNDGWHTTDGDGNVIHPPGTNWQDVADLNFANSDMREAMIDAMKYWALEANIDGFRCDYADGVPYYFWKEAIDSIRSIPNRKFLFFAEGTRSDHFSAGFDLNFGWEFYGAIKSVYEGQSVSTIFETHQNVYDNTPSGKHWIRFTTNHDESAWDATPINIFNGKDGALAASIVTIFIGGAPLIYGSQEVGTSQNVPFFSNSSINWTANPDMKNSYEKMLQFYSGSQSSRIGENTNYSNNDIACFKKLHDNDEVLILANLRNTNLGFSIPAELENINWTDIMADSAVNLSGVINLLPYQFYILD